MKRRRPLGGTGSLPLSLLPLYLFTLAFVLVPFIYMIALSFMTRDGAWGVSRIWTLRNYLRAGAAEYRETFSQSLRLACSSTLITALAGYPFGYFMARLAAPWKQRVMLLLIIPFWTSSLLRLYGWIILFRANGLLDALLRALGLRDEPLRLLYNYPAVVQGMSYALLPFMIYAVYSSAEKLDRSLIEAARDLGAPPLRAFLTVSFPLTMPGLFSGVALTFIPSMGLFFVADILGGKVALAGSLIHQQILRTHDWPFAAALSVVLTALTGLCLYLYRRISRSHELEGLI